VGWSLIGRVGLCSCGSPSGCRWGRSPCVGRGRVVRQARALTYHVAPGTNKPAPFRQLVQVVAIRGRGEVFITGNVSDFLGTKALAAVSWLKERRQQDLLQRCRAWM
jgi:hypothetical protein